MTILPSSFLMIVDNTPRLNTIDLGLYSVVILPDDDPLLMDRHALANLFRSRLKYGLGIDVLDLTIGYGVDRSTNGLNIATFDTKVSVRGDDSVIYSPDFFQQFTYDATQT